MSFYFRFMLGPSVIISIGIHSNISAPIRKKNIYFKLIFLPWNMCTNPSSFQLFQKIWVLYASFFCDIGLTEIIMICSENRHTKNYQNIPKVNLSQQKIREHPIIGLLSIKHSFNLVQENTAITCILTNDSQSIGNIDFHIEQKCPPIPGT